MHVLCSKNERRASSDENSSIKNTSIRAYVHGPPSKAVLYTWETVGVEGKPTCLDSWPFKMGPIDGPETSVINYHYSLCNNPEELSSHLLRGGRLKSRKFRKYTLSFLVELPPTPQFEMKYVKYKSYIVTDSMFKSTAPWTWS